MRFAYADPPYFRMGARLYGGLHDEAGVWDSRGAHVELVGRLVGEFPDGWALSCLPADLVWLLPVCPEGVRVGAWCKTFHQIKPLSVQYAWEPVVWCGGRQVKGRKPMVRDWLACTRGQRLGLVGAKPRQFNEWVLDLLGFDPDQDELVDMFPGSGGMGRQATQGKLFP